MFHYGHTQCSSKQENTQNNYKAIRDLTYHIANVGVDLKNTNENRQDIDIASYSYNDAKYIRKQMQINNEDLQIYLPQLWRKIFF